MLMDKNGIIALSGFDGIAGGYEALYRAGIKVASYMSSDLLMLEQKNGKLKPNPAVLIARANHPDIIELGDIRNIDARFLNGKLDLLLGGSPCQTFSSAGPRTGFDGSSGLLLDWIRIKNEANPTYWLLENVEMKKEWEDIISNLLGVPAIHINSSLVSGQNRPRTYWTNIPYTPITDKEIMLSDQVLGAKCGTNKHGKLVPNISELLGVEGN